MLTVNISKIYVEEYPVKECYDIDIDALTNHISELIVPEIT